MKQQIKLPVEFEANMKKMLGDEFDSYLECLNQPMKHGLRINTMKISVEDFMKINPFTLEPVPWCPNGFYYDENIDKPSKHPYYYAGLYYIQEPSAMTPASVLPVMENERVLDICAAPGGKSTELVAKLNGTGILVSNDVSASRAKALLKNLEVFGATNSLIISEATNKLATRFPEYFDKILIDAPCSGEGMFRKSNSMITAWENNGNQLFVDLQRSILKDVVKMLKPGGMLLYSTCTFSPLENEQSIEYLLSLDDSLSIADFDKYEHFDDGHPNWSCSGRADLVKSARLWPHRISGEGHFVCLIKKAGEKANVVSRGDYPLKKAKLTKETLDFLKRVKLPLSEDRIEASMDKLYYIPEAFPSVKGLRILRCGLFLGEVKKNRFEPSQALAMALNKDLFDNVLSISASDDRVIKFLKGETIDTDLDEDISNGYVLVCVDGYPLGWGKSNDGTIKNKYLPGWRLL